MTTIAATFSKNIPQQRVVRKIYFRPCYLRRIRRFIEIADWPETVLISEKRLNKICAGIIIAAFLYCGPIFIKVFLR